MNTRTPTSTPADGTWTIRRVLEWTSGYLREKGSESPRLEAEVLLAHARGCPRIQLYTAYDEPLPDAVRARMREMVQRRAASEPVAYIVGHREFFSLDFEVTPDVLIPRPDTETLIVEVLERLKSRPNARILEIGAGSGCIAIALAVNQPDAVVTAVDISPAAIAVARRNAQRNNVADRVTFVEGDMFSPIAADAQYDVIVSNPPYVRIDEMEQLDPEVRLHEPHGALRGGEDGMDILRRIIDGAAPYLVKNGWLALECAREQAAVLQQQISGRSEFTNVRIVNDATGHPRVVLARRTNV
ncbi:MAG: peptide chain release factor N(5)-glutamine methyltransferase [Planctomycetaceae bacterium]